jgi:hypothetical protein
VTKCRINGAVCWGEDSDQLSTLTWLNRFRRLKIRYEHRADIHLAFLNLAAPSSPCVSSANVSVIKYCALTTAIFILGAEGYLSIFMRGKDDIAGGVMMNGFIIFVSAIIATAAAVFERILQNAVDIKSENDLTV